MDFPMKELSLLVLLLVCCPFRSLQQVTDVDDKRYIGCFADAFDRILPDYRCAPGGAPECPDCAGPRIDDPPGHGTGCQNGAMTVEICLALCGANGHTYAGLESGNECYCGGEDAVLSKLREDVNGMNCNSPCGGKADQACGGQFWISVYDLRKSCSISAGNLDEFITPSEPVSINGMDVVFDTGKILSFTCQTGYTISGPAQVTCQADGTFSPNLPTCTPPDTISGVTCPALPPPENGIISPRQETFSEGQIVTYACPAGYAVQGQETRTCTSMGETGKWDGTNTTCVVKECGTPPTIENAKWTADSGFAAGNSILYTCLEGFQLEAEKESFVAVCREASLTWDGTYFACTPVDGGNNGGTGGNTNGGSGNVPSDQSPETGGYLRGFDSLLWIIAIIIVVGITIMLIGCIVVHTVSQDTAANKRTNDNTMLVVPAADNQPPTNDHHQFGVTDDRDKVERNAV